MKEILEQIKKYCKEHKGRALSFILLLIATYMLMFSFIGAVSDRRADNELEYTEFVAQLEDGNVDLVYYNPTEEYMKVVLFNKDTRDLSDKERRKHKHSDSEIYKVIYPGETSIILQDHDGDLKEIPFRQAMIEQGAIPILDHNSSIVTGAVSLIGTILVYGVVFLVLMKVMNATMARGLSEKDVIQTSDVKFSNIIGHEEIIDDIQFITDLIKDPTKGDKIGAKLPKGILFAGPPGTGKTLLAKAIANEAGVPFLYQNASGFIEMYVGLGARRVRDLFKIARKNAPCVVFLDEIDAIGGDRNSSRGNSESEQTINALLQEMDGFTGRDGVFIIAATNRPETLDSALVRSGRFDRQINVNPPRDWVVRRDMFRHYLENFTVDKNLDIDSISKQVSGFTGADIAMVCNEASIIAVMSEKDCIDDACIEEAIDKKVFNGNRSKYRPHDNDMEITAYHEAGHAVMNYLKGIPIARASVQPTTSGVGGAVISQDKVTVYMTKRDLENMVLVAYAGRASEEIKFSDVTTGASSDITQATNILKQYVSKFGFDDATGLIDTDVLLKSNIIDPDGLENKISELSRKLYEQCRDTLSANYKMVELVAQRLLSDETISGSDIEDMLHTVEKVSV